MVTELEGIKPARLSPLKLLQGGIGKNRIVNITPVTAHSAFPGIACKGKLLTDKSPAGLQGVPPSGTTAVLWDGLQPEMLVYLLAGPEKAAGQELWVPGLQHLIRCFWQPGPCQLPPPNNNNHSQQVPYLIPAASLQEISQASRCHVLSLKPWIQAQLVQSQKPGVFQSNGWESRNIQFF